MKKVFIITSLTICTVFGQNADCSGNLPFEWVPVQAGSYTSGHENKIKRIDYDFQIMKYEVTNIQYTHFLNEAFSDSSIWIENGDIYGSFDGNKHLSAGDYLYIELSAPACQINWEKNSFTVKPGFECYPVVEVTWIGAMAMAVYYGYRLPNEMEWEKTARGETGWKYPWGDWDLNCELANYFGCYGSPIPVGQTKGVSVYDAYDMAGNVWEWTDTLWNNAFDQRVLRGGSWFFDANYLPAWYRYAETPTQHDFNIGFRLVK